MPRPKKQRFHGPGATTLNAQYEIEQEMRWREIEAQRAGLTPNDPKTKFHKQNKRVTRAVVNLSCNVDTIAALGWLEEHMDMKRGVVIDWLMQDWVKKMQDEHLQIIGAKPKPAPPRKRTPFEIQELSNDRKTAKKFGLKLGDVTGRPEDDDDPLEDEEEAEDDDA